MDFQKIQIDVDGLPEVGQFVRIVNGVHRETQGSDISLSINPFTRFGIV